MTVDIIAGYYQQAHRMPTFHWGMEANRSHINKVFVVSDGPFDKQTPYPYTFLSHPKLPHGNGASFNQGAHASRADYVLFTGVDLTLQPGAVAAALDKSSPTRLVIGAVDSIDNNTAFTDFPNPQVTLVDMDDRNGRFKTYGNSLKSYYLARNGHTLVNRETFLALGGFDERFSQAGYGYEDWEFGMRWCKAFTGQNIVRSGARAWHFDGAPKEIKDRKRPSDAALKLYLQCEAAYHENRLSLFEKHVLIDVASVAHLTSDTPPDMRAVDCNDITWVPPLSLAYLSTYPSQATNPQQHIVDCWGKLQNGGVLQLLEFDDDQLLDILGDIAFVNSTLGQIVIKKKL